MSQELVVGGILVAIFFSLWWITSRVGKRDRQNQTTAMQRENNELRHVVTEMSMDKHRSQEENRRGR